MLYIIKFPFYVIRNVLKVLCVFYGWRNRELIQSVNCMMVSEWQSCGRNWPGTPRARDLGHHTELLCLSCLELFFILSRFWIAHKI